MMQAAALPANTNDPFERRSSTRGANYPFLVLTPARTQDWLWAAVLMPLSTLVFLALLPFATHPLEPMPGFIGVYQSALIVIQLLIALLLFAKFSVLRLNAVLFLASAYLFSAVMAGAHALTFPGLFRATGLLAATPQTTAWIYMFWHLGFPLMVMAYARTKRLDAQPGSERGLWPIFATIAAVALAVGALVALASVGSWMLPNIMVGNVQNYPVIKPVVSFVCLMNLAAFLVLWRSRPYNVLDVWLMIECWTWAFDIALSAVFNAARFDVGFYFGRAYGLFAAILILGVLLFESTKLYARLLSAHAKDIAVNQELQRLYDKARELDKLKTRFFANMSHEIRTPMNAIIGITYLLRRGNPTHEQVERLDKIAMASRHLLTIINDILDFSKIESGMMVLEQAPFPISAILDHTRSLIEDSAQAKGLVISLDYDDCPHWLIGDQTRLRQAMLNYASNAVKFTDQGEVGLHCTLVEQTGDDVTILFDVTDTGIGIPVDARSELFTAFKQVDASTTRKYGGTGLGLAITQRLAQLMGGEVGVDSEPGKGSRFWFTARLKVGRPLEQHANSNAEQELRTSHAGTKILLVEDDPINLEIARVMLTEAGMQVEMANDGQQAVDRVTTQDFDLILMDLQMPVMDGIEATRQIRQLDRGKDIPIIALTANIFDEDRRISRMAGMTDFVGKPVDPLELFAMILKWLPKASNVHISALQAPGPRTVHDRTGLMERLQGVEGLDLDLGLSTVRGDLALYWQLLRDFVYFHSNDMLQVRKSLEREQRSVAIRTAHTLKGAAASLGLTDLQHSAAQLESSLTAGVSDIACLSNRIAQAQLKLAQSLAGIAPEDVGPLAAPDVSQANEILGQIQTALKTGDFRANQMFRENLPLFRASLPRVSCRRLEAAMDSYDYDTALAVVGDIRQVLQES